MSSNRSTTRTDLARLVAARTALAAALDAGDANAPQRSATTLLTRLLFLRQLQTWSLLADDADLGALAHGDVAPFNALFGTTLSSLAAWQLGSLSLFDLPNDAPFSTLIGALVEKQGDQKRLGAYYTSADVSGYIAAQCIVPALLDAVIQRCSGQFQACWHLIQADPDRYIPASLRHGCDLPLPAEIARGVDDVTARTGWNAPAPPSHALPNEIWREVVTRRRRYVVLREKLIDGAVRTPNDLITCNLDVQQFALDSITHGTDTELLAAFWDVLNQLVILDPTCGSGAFLLAALAVLRPLYAACLQRMPTPISAAESVKAIIANNLHGVDIVPEAAEACRLRLYLAYAAEVKQIEYLTDLTELCRNIAVGNVLATHDQRPAATKRSNHRQYDVIIGNPPYLATSKAPYTVCGYATERCGNLYALVIERSLALLRPGGRMGMIVPIASVSTKAMRPLQRLYDELGQWHSHYAVRPGKLFPDVDMNLTITLLHNARNASRCYSTGYRRWSSSAAHERAHIFATLAYTENPRLVAHANPLPKLGSARESQILGKMLAHGHKLRDYVTNDGAALYYHSGGRYWRKALLDKRSSHYRPLIVPAHLLPIIGCLLNSQLFYWYWISNSNCMDVVAREVLDLPIFAVDTLAVEPFDTLLTRLLAAYERGSATRTRRGSQIHVDELNVDARVAKPIIDDIDRALAHGYGFSAEELDFVLNYDIKYRMPLDQAVV